MKQIRANYSFAFAFANNKLNEILIWIFWVIKQQIYFVPFLLKKNSSFKYYLEYNTKKNRKSKRFYFMFTSLKRIRTQNYARVVGILNFLPLFSILSFPIYPLYVHTVQTDFVLCKDSWISGMWVHKNY